MQCGCMYPLIYMQSRRCIQRRRGEGERAREGWRARKRTTLRAVLIVSVMSKAKPILFEQLMVGSGRFDVKHDRVIKLPCSRGVIMSDAYRYEDVICRGHLPDVIFFSTLKCGETIYAPRDFYRERDFVTLSSREIKYRYVMRINHQVPYCCTCTRNMLILIFF